VTVAVVSSKAEEVGLKVRVLEAYVTNDGLLKDKDIVWPSSSIYAGRT
jgi:hypothetical protein